MIKERFWRQVRKTKTCWLWEGCKNTYGYGDIGIEGKNLKVHRLSYEWTNGPIPEGYTIDHICRVRHCVNPEHLEAVDNRTNILRGIGLTATNSRKKFCQKGHEFTKDNTIIQIRKSSGRPRRSCRACKYESAKKMYWIHKY